MHTTSTSSGIGIEIPATERRRAPVFVVGCHRSGTNLLYDTLLSAGGFALYRGYLPIYKMLIPKFGRIDDPGNRAKIVQAWMHSKGFRRSGLDAKMLSSDLFANCRSGGDFMRTVMDKIATDQGVPRWAVYDPDNVLYMSRIKADLPGALFLHIVRDGRDVALSLRKMGGFRPIPWARKAGSLQATALYWQWMVERGRQWGRMFPQDYMEVSYEELVTDPRPTLEALGQFLHHDFDVEKIQDAGLGRLSESNSSFREESSETAVNPVGRWKERLSQEEVASLEALVGDTLESHGYQLTVGPQQREPNLRQKTMRLAYPAFLDMKLWLKTQTPAGRLGNLSALELSD